MNIIAIQWRDTSDHVKITYMSGCPTIAHRTTYRRLSFCSSVYAERDYSNYSPLKATISCIILGTIYAFRLFNVLRESKMFKDSSERF